MPADNPMSEAKVELGRHLFYDGRLSADETIACSSCHDQAKAFTDGKKRSLGIHNNLTNNNSPSLANTAYLPALTWANPHMSSLEFQALVPLFGEEPEEMGSVGKETKIFTRLSSDAYYSKAFKKAFPEKPSPSLFTITRALGAFQRSLMSFQSPYDKFKYGKQKDALSQSAKRGEQLFFDHHFECYHCHQGILLTDNMQRSGSPWKETGFHNTGLYEKYPSSAQGLIEITGKDEDAGVFRTPSLRNVAVTAPYMHDGSISDLKGVIEHYAKGGRAKHPMKDGMIVGFKATDKDIDDLIAFLESLTDEAFLKNPSHSDPWPADHPATKNRVNP